MNDDSPTFIPTQEELDLLHRLEAGEKMAFPDDIKLDTSERIYENGFIGVGVDGGLAITERGRELAQSAMTTAV